MQETKPLINLSRINLGKKKKQNRGGREGDMKKLQISGREEIGSNRREDRDALLSCVAIAISRVSFVLISFQHVSSLAASPCINET